MAVAESNLNTKLLGACSWYLVKCYNLFYAISAKEWALLALEKPSCL